MKIKNFFTLAAFLLLILAGCSTKPAPTTTTSENTIPFKEALARIEYNSTDGDLGFQVELDAPSWQQVAVVGPDGNKLFEVKNQGSLGVQGLTHLYFESTERKLADLSREQFLARFPEGEYTAVGVTVAGEKLMSPMEFTHLIPDPPQIISPAEGEVVPINEVVIAWEPVTSPEGVEVDFYQLFLFPVDPPEGQAPIELNIDFALEVPASVTQVRIPAELLTPGAEYQFELKALDTNYNNTVTVGFFKTEAHSGSASTDEPVNLNPEHVAGDVTILEFIWQRVGHTVDASTATDINALLGNLRIAADGEDLEASAETASKLLNIVTGLTLGG